MTNDNKLQATVKSTPVESKKRANEEPATQIQARIRLRLIPIWLRIILVIVLFLIVAALGVMFGYSALGDGDAFDALKWSTWQHILDIIKGVE